jgi:sugar phosphate isomerase/epimerase
MIRGGGSIDDLLQLLGDRLANFHINDVPADPDPLTQPPTTASWLATESPICRK